MTAPLYDLDNLPNAIPFEVDATHKPISWITAFILYLSIIGAWGVVTLFSLATTLAPSDVRELTLELPPAALQEAMLGVGRTSSAAETTDARTTAVMEIMRQQPGVVQVTLLSATEMQRLLAPWFGASFTPEDLLFPQLIQVTVRQKRSGDYDHFNEHATLKKIRTLVPDAAFLPSDSWLDTLQRFTFRLQFLMGGMMIIFLGVAMAVVAFATRTNLLMQQSVIELLTLLGATDSFIAQRFERMTLIMAMEALAKALVGVILTLGLLWWALHDVHAANSIDVWWRLVGWRSLFLGITPLLMIGLMVYSARRCVMRDLERLF